MASDLLALLLRTTFVTSLVILVMLALRLPLRRLFGSGVAYAAWLAVPLCTVATLLPTALAPALPATFAAAARPLGQVVGATSAAPSALWPWAALAFWLTGVACLAAWQVLRQRSFIRSLGTLRRSDAISIAESPHAGPALVGLVHPIIVVPCDFEQRYTSAERVLILAHERAHARRGDAMANLGCAIVQCLWWFNPLVHLAAQLVRLDQELACDADVMRSHPASQRDYASAMLKTQLAVSSAPLACQWQPNHPVKERIMNLNRSTSRTMRMTGRAILAAALAGSSYAAWAVQAAPAPTAQTYDMALELDMDGVRAAPRLRVAAGEKAAVEMGEGAGKWRATFVVNPTRNKALYITTTLARDGKIVGAPNIVVNVGEQAELKYALANNVKVAMRLKVTPSAAPSAN